MLPRGYLCLRYFSVANIGHARAYGYQIRHSRAGGNPDSVGFYVTLMDSRLRGNDDFRFPLRQTPPPTTAQSRWCCFIVWTVWFIISLQRSWLHLVDEVFSELP